MHESTSVSSRKRRRSPSPHEEVEEDPTNRETLAAVRELLQIEVPEDPLINPLKYLGLKIKIPRKNRSFLWSCPLWMAFYRDEAKAYGNPKKGEPERLQCSPVNADNFLQYNRPPTKFYRSLTMELGSSAPKCQDAFRSLFPKAVPSSVHIPMRQHTSMETVTRESIQILSYAGRQVPIFMSSLCGVGVRVRVRVNNFSSKTTRPGDVLFFLKDTLFIEDEKLFKACKSVCSSVC